MPNPPSETAFGEIAAAAEAANEKAEAAPLDERVARLEAQLSSIEPLLEQLQSQSRTAIKIDEYVDLLKKEQSFFNIARYVLAAIWLFVVIFLLWLLRDSVYNPKSPLLSAPPLAVAAFIVGIVSGIVLLLSGFVKGIFRTASERHAEGFLPPTLDAALDAYQKLAGKNG